MMIGYSRQPMRSRYLQYKTKNVFGDGDRESYYASADSAGEAYPAVLAAYLATSDL